jgi:hypothetical protein
MWDRSRGGGGLICGRLYRTMGAGTCLRKSEAKYAGVNMGHVHEGDAGRDACIRVFVTGSGGGTRVKNVKGGGTQPAVGPLPTTVINSPRGTKSRRWSFPSCLCLGVFV